jgi:hypothetical protein
VRIGDDFSRKSKVVSKVFDTFVRQVAVIVLPREGNFDQAPRVQTLHEHENFQVGWSFDVRMRLRTRVLLDDTNSLFEEVAESSNAVFLRNEHSSFDW